MLNSQVALPSLVGSGDTGQENLQARMDVFKDNEMNGMEMFLLFN